MALYLNFNISSGYVFDWTTITDYIHNSHITFSCIIETLAQNNIAMKKQVETMTQWQKEVQRVQESHKEKFSDTKQYIAMVCRILLNAIISNLLNH